MWPWHSPIWDSPSCRATLRAGCLSQRHLVLTATALPSTERRPGCLPLRKLTLEMQVLMKGKGFIQVLAIWKVGDSCLKAHLPGDIEDSRLKVQHLHISVEAEVFMGRDRGQNKEVKRGAYEVQTHTVHSCRSSDGRCASSWFNHPDCTSCGLHSWRPANLPELGCLEVGVCTFWS